MDIDLYKSGPITFIDLDGEMNADNCMEIRDMVMESLAVNKHFVINIKNVPYMDSTSIGTLMAIVKEVQLLDGSIKLVGVNNSLKRIFELVNADEVFDMFEKTEDAVNSLGMAVATEV